MIEKFNLSDRTDRLVLADWLREHDREREAALLCSDEPVILHNDLLFEMPELQSPCDGRHNYLVKGGLADAVLHAHHSGYVTDILSVLRYDPSAKPPLWFAADGPARSGPILTPGQFLHLLAADAADHCRSHMNISWLKPDRRLTAANALRDLCLFLGDRALAEECQDLARCVQEQEQREQERLAKIRADEVALADRVRQSFGTGAFTREDADRLTGYNAGVARREFARDGSLLLVIVADDAPRNHRLRRVKQGSPILYYRKASAGKWSRSVDKTYVLPVEKA